LNTMVGSPKVKQRSRPDLVVSDSYSDVYNASHVLQSHNFNGLYTTDQDSESIVYTTKRASQRAKSNYCYHLKESFHYGGGTGAMFLNNVSPSGWTTDYRGHHANVCGAKASIIAAVDTQLTRVKGAVLGAGGLGYMNTAFDRLQPNLTTVSIPNFLLDIEDLTKLYKIWKIRSQRGPGGIYERYLRIKYDTKGRLKRATKSDVVTYAAGKHLAYKFGWKPTVADLSDLIEGVTKLRSKLKAFESQLGKIMQSSCSVSLGLPTSATGTITWPSGNHTASYSASCTRKCTAYIAYAPQPLAVMGPMDTVLRGLLDSMGFELNPRIIWDAIPFSFVIDWFFGVGSWLGRFKIDALELPIVLVDAFLQYEEVTKIEWSWLRANDGTYTTRPKSGGATFERKFFHRMPIGPDPVTLQGLGWKMPTLNQAALGVSLATVLGMSKGR